MNPKRFHWQDGWAVRRWSRGLRNWQGGPLEAAAVTMAWMQAKAGCPMDNHITVPCTLRGINRDRETSGRKTQRAPRTAGSEGGRAGSGCIPEWRRESKAEVQCAACVPSVWRVLIAGITLKRKKGDKPHTKAHQLSHPAALLLSCLSWCQEWVTSAWNHSANGYSLVLAEEGVQRRQKVFYCQHPQQTELFFLL